MGVLYICVYITQWESGTIRVNQRSASVACGNKQWQGAALLQGASRGNLTSYAIRGYSVGIRHNPCQSVIGGKQWHAGAT
jgi:hypothetical protein